MEIGIYQIGECEYCGQENQILRPTPFMADRCAMMCEHCWKDTKEEYAASNGEYIGDFNEMKEDYDKLMHLIETGIEVIQMSLDGALGYVLKKEEYKEFEHEIEGHNEDSINPVRKEFALNCLKEMECGDEFFVGTMEFKCYKMPKEQFENLNEFNGW